VASDECLLMQRHVQCSRPGVKVCSMQAVPVLFEKMPKTGMDAWPQAVGVSAANKFSCVTDYKLDPLQNQTCNSKRHTDTYIKLRKNQLSLLCALHTNTLSHRQTSSTTHTATDTYQHAPTQLTRIHCITNTRRQKERVEKS